MLCRCKVYKDKQFNYIAKFPKPVASVEHGKRFPSRKREIFSLLYEEAQENGVSKKNMLSYIENRNRELYDIEDWFVEDEAKELWKRKLNAIHKKKKRYEQKCFLNVWSYFVTFTYDDKKESAESFAARLRKALSNFSSRHGWRYIGAEERGEIGGRLHYHFIIYVPPGEMVGSLFMDYKRSKKRRKMEYFLNNTYFQERFGQSCWETITQEDMKNGKVRKYLIKYLTKSNGKLIYSRGIPSEYDVEIDTEKDVKSTFRRYGICAVLFEHVFGEIINKFSDYEMEESDPDLCYPEFSRWDPLTNIVLA